MTAKPSTETILEAALQYAKIGLPVFPCDPLNKRPLVKWGNGATTDERQVRRWWSTWPQAMIGLPTGRRSGIVVLDIDRKNGVDGLASLESAGIEVPRPSVITRTPTGGLHYYFEAPRGYAVPNSAGKIAEGVDVRGDGGYVVVPPSKLTGEANGYSFVEGSLCS